ncbi:Major facilitator superfamily protein isoform 2 [Hibiscus syriacus]|uniref:Major facilitator superfamily protein isoform 2 n=1 Tax=Hibiscus syriacus TaxID=106335 RepID=A0A6A3CKV7_HIBSY|nr:Major facilitator superfamily protein isoform 2 [Hibiscus syriacus]
MMAETLTLVLVNLAGIMEKADESLLPGVYKEVALGAFLWAAATFLLAFSTFFQVAISRALNGIGLAIVADSTDDSNRGMAFGWLQVTSNLGSVIGGFIAVLLAPITFIGIPGWRIAFHLVGLISIIVGTLVNLFANDPHFSNGGMKSGNQVSNRSLWSELMGLVQEAKTVIKIPSFQIIVAQGVTGSFPWSALSFAPMWLELIGFSHEKTAFLIALFVIATSVGGGSLGCDAWLVPNHCWLLHFLECSSRKQKGASESEEIATDRENASSLAKALYTAIGIPMALCCFIYSFLYFTYPRDRKRAQMEAHIESEMQVLLSDAIPEGGDHSQAQSFELEEPYIKDRTIIEVDYGEEVDIDPDEYDENDEKTILYRQLSLS